RDPAAAPTGCADAAAPHQMRDKPLNKMRSRRAARTSRAACRLHCLGANHNQTRGEKPMRRILIGLAMSTLFVAPAFAKTHVARKATIARSDKAAEGKPAEAKPAEGAKP